MNLSDFNFKWSEVEESSFSPVSPGTYAAKISDSEIKVSKKGDKYLKLEYTLLGKKGIKGRKIFENYFLVHSNPKTVQIALGKLKSLLKKLEIDYSDFQDSSMLHGKMIGVKVKIESSKDYGDQNRVQDFVEYSEELLEADQEDVA